MGAFFSGIHARHYIWICIAAVLLSVPGPGLAQEQRPVIALLPVADVSAGTVSWDKGLQQELHTALRAGSFPMVETELVLEAVRALRLRDLGEVDRFSCRQLGERLGCTFILGVSITEATGGDAPVLGLLLQLYHAASGIPVWGETFTCSAAEQVALLGLEKVADLSRLNSQAAQSLVARLAALPFTTLRPPETRVVPDYDIEVVDCSGSLVRCGDTVQCRVKIRTGSADISNFNLELAGKIFSLNQTGQQDVYSAQVETPPEPGAYTIRLKRSGLETDVAYSTVAQIETVCEAPYLELESSAIADTTRNVPVFSNRLALRPRMENKRPVDNWTFEVLDSQQNRVVSQQRNGDLPAILYWRGIDSRRYPLPSGRYTLKVRIQDTAGFTGSASTEVYLHQPHAELATLEKVHKDGRTALLLRNKHADAEPRDWKVYITDSRDNELYKISGTTLPAKIILPEKITQNQEVFCQVYIQDNMGNRYWTETTPVEQYIAADEKEDEAQEQRLVWNTGF